MGINMILETERLIAKEYSINELNNYYLLQSNELVWRYSTNIVAKCKKDAKVKLLEVIDNYKREDIGFLALYYKENSRFIGEAGILSFNKKAQRCEVGYNILPEFWNQGYASEITSGLVKYAFNTLQAERVEALVMEKDKASCRVLEKSGLKLEGQLKHFSKVSNQYIDGFADVLYYGVIKGEYAG